MNLVRHNVILSASYPIEGRDPRYLQNADVSRRVAEAVIPLASALIANGATISFGGHPAITRLLAGVVSNFASPVQRVSEGFGAKAPIAETAVGRVILYQSAAFTAIEEVDWLRSSPLVSVVDVSVDPEEIRLGKNRSPLDYPKTLRNLRQKLFHALRPSALVCIGGMDGIIYEKNQFAEEYPDLPIFAYATTGGASQLIAEGDKHQLIKIPDQEPHSQSGLEPDAASWKFTENELAEFGPYTKAAYEVAIYLSHLN